MEYHGIPGDFILVLCDSQLEFNGLAIALLSTQAMHNYKISETNHLRVSFSKSPIS